MTKIGSRCMLPNSLMYQLNKFKVVQKFVLFMLSGFGYSLFTLWYTMAPFNIIIVTIIVQISDSEK